jgi:hypothetical protein
MKKSSFGNRSRNSHGMSRVMEFVPINRVVDYFQNAIVNFQLFGLGTGAVVSVALLVSVFSHWTHPYVEKGVL